MATDRFAQATWGRKTQHGPAHYFRHASTSSLCGKMNRESILFPMVRPHTADRCSECNRMLSEPSPEPNKPAPSAPQAVEPVPRTVDPPSDDERDGGGPADQDTLAIPVTDKMVAYLDELVATGLWGDDQAEVAARLVADGILRCIADGFLEVIDGRS